MVTLAHQGGWDELLMVAAPLILVTGLLLVANRRASQELARRDADEEARATVPPDESTT